MSVTTLYELNNQALIHYLPMKEQSFLVELRKYDLLPEGIYEEVLSVNERVQRASYFLDKVIKPDLANKKAMNFNTLLNIMMKSNVDYVVGLSLKIKCELLVIENTLGFTNVLKYLAHM